MEKVMTPRPSRRGIAVATVDGFTGVLRQAADQTLAGLPLRHRKYVLTSTRGEYTATVEMTRPGVKQLLRRSARITGRVA